MFYEGILLICVFIRLIVKVFNILLYCILILYINLRVIIDNLNNNQNALIYDNMISLIY